MPTKNKHRHKPSTPKQRPDVLGVHETAALLTVSVDTVYDLFAKGELPGRKVGRKWITTKAAVMRWIEASSTDDTLARSIEKGGPEALAKAMNSGRVRVKKSN